MHASETLSSHLSGQWFLTVYIRLHCNGGREVDDGIIDGTVAGPQEGGSDFQLLRRKKSP